MIARRFSQGLTGGASLDARAAGIGRGCGPRRFKLRENLFAIMDLMRSVAVVRGAGYAQSYAARRGQTVVFRNENKDLTDKNCVANAVGVRGEGGQEKPPLGGFSCHPPAPPGSGCAPARAVGSPPGLEREVIRDPVPSTKANLKTTAQIRAGCCCLERVVL